MFFQIDVAQLAGLIVEGIFWGIFITLTLMSGYHQLVTGRRRRESLNIPILITTILMTILATAQLIVDCRNVFVAFFNKPTREDRIAYFMDLSKSLFTARDGIFICMLAVADLFVTYRAYVVWHSNIWIVVLPILLSLASAACGFKVLYTSQHDTGATVKEETAWILSVFALSLCANAISTGLLAVRIWMAQRQTRGKVSGVQLMPVVRIILESGVLNATYLLVFIILLVTGSQAVQTMSEMATSLSGIIFTIVILRVQHNTDKDHSSAGVHYANSGDAPSKLVCQRRSQLSTVEFSSVGLSTMGSTGVTATVTSERCRGAYNCNKDLPSPLEACEEEKLSISKV